MAIDAPFSILLNGDKVVVCQGEVLKYVEVSIVGGSMALTASITRKSFPPIGLRAVIYEQLNILLGPKERRKSIRANRRFQGSDFIDPQECTKVFDLGNVKDAFPESKAGVHGFG